MMGMVLLVLVLLQQQQKQPLSYCGVSMTLKQSKAKHRVVVVVEGGGYHGSWLRGVSVGDRKIFEDGMPGFCARGVSMFLLRFCFDIVFIYLLLLLVPSSHTWFSCSCSCSGSGSAAVRRAFESLALPLFLPFASPS